MSNGCHLFRYRLSRVGLRIFSVSQGMIWQTGFTFLSAAFFKVRLGLFGASRRARWKRGFTCSGSASLRED